MPHQLAVEPPSPDAPELVTRPDLAAAAAALLPHAGVLDAAELERFVATVAARPELWRELVVVDPLRRRYRLLYEDERIDAWVLSWMPGQGTGFHDHDVSHVGLAAAQGCVIERQMVLPEGVTATALRRGVSRRGPAGYIHSVAHGEGTPAVTIHAYSPPLMRVGQYEVDGDGILRRRIEHGRQELLDRTIAGALAIDTL